MTRQEAKARGIDQQVSDAQQKPENQIAAIRSFIAEGVHGILLAPVVATGWDAVLEEAREVEIPVAPLDRMVGSDPSLDLTAIGSDLVHEGEANAPVEPTPNRAGPALDALAAFMADGTEPENSF